MGPKHLPHQTSVGLSAIVLACLALPGVSPARADDMFRYESVPTLGGTYGEAWDVNDAGQVVGYGETAGGQRHAFVWTAAGGIQDIHGLGTESTAYGINGSGHVVGTVTVGGNRHAFLWTPGGGMQDLGTPGGAWAEARGINDSGQLTVSGLNAGGQEHAYIWTSGGGGTWQDLGTLGGGWSVARAINSSGHIAGHSTLVGGAWHAFLWTPGGGMQDLGTLGGDQSCADGMNDLDAVCGVAMTSAGDWDWHAFYKSSGGAMQDLGTLGGDTSWAYDVNNAGMVVGYSHTTPGDGSVFAHIWTAETGMLELRDLTHGGGYLGRARAINERGQIVGDSWVGWMLTPELSWQSGAGGNWDDAGAWSWGLTPDEIYPVLVNADSGAITVVGPGSDTTVAEVNVGTDGAGTVELLLQNGVTLTVDNAANPNICNGKVNIGANGVLRTRASNLVADIDNDGRVLFDDSTNSTFAGQITGSGSVVKSNTGVLTLTGINGYTGGTTIYGGVVAVGRDENLGSGDVRFRGGTLRVTGTSYGSTWRNVDVGAAGGTIEVTDPDHTFGLGVFSSITGSGDLTKTGPGTLAVYAFHPGYGGRFVVGAGTLRSSGNYLSADVVNDASVVLADDSDTTYAGSISGSGSLTKEGDGTLTLTGAHSYAGETIVAGGTVRLGGDDTLDDRTVVTLAGGTGLDVDSHSDTIGALAGAGRVALGSGTLTIGGGGGGATFSGVISGAGALVKAGSGTQVLTGPSTYGGGTHLEGGVLAVDHDSRLGDPAGELVFDGGALGATSSFTTGRDADLGPAGGGLQADGGVTLTWAGAISGDGALTCPGPGTVALTGTNTYTGGTHLDGGTLEVARDAGLGGPGGGLVFGGGTLRTTGTFATNRSVALQAAGGAFRTDGGTTLTLNGAVAGTGGLTKAGGGTLVIGGAGTYDGATDINAGVLRLAADERLPDLTAVTISGGAVLDLDGHDETIGSLAGGCAVTLGTGGLTVGANNASTAFTGAICGDGSVTKVGTGTLTLTGTNTYTGGTIVTTGTLAGTTVGVQGAIANNALVVFDQAFDGTYAGVMSGTGTLTKTGGGTLTVTGTNSYAGGTRLEAGRLAVARDASLGDPDGPLVFDGGTLRADAAFASSRAVTLGGGGGIIETPAAATLTLTGPIGGAGGLTKLGPDTLVLTGTNSYTGGTAVVSGTLRGTTRGVQGDIFNGAAVVFDQAFDGAYAGTMSGAGTLTKTGVGEVALGAINGYSGGTYLYDGALAVDADGCLGTPTAGLTFDGGALRTTASFATARGAALLAGGGAIATDAATTLTYNGAIAGAGALSKRGGGVLLLGAANTYTGATIVETGTLRLGAPQRLADVTATTVAGGGTFDLDGHDETIGSLAGTGSVVLGAGTLTVGANDTDADFAGGIGGTGALIKTGTATQTLSGASSYTGGTYLNEGTLAVAADAPLGGPAGGLIFNTGTLRATGSFVTARAVTLNPGGGTVQVDAGHRLSFDGTVSGTGSLTKTGPGRLALNAGNGYQGGTWFVEGDVEVAADGSLGHSGGDLHFRGGMLRVTGTAFTATSRTIDWDDGGFDIAHPDNTFTITQELGGGGSLVKDGPGTLYLRGNTFYDGDTTILDGILRYYRSNHGHTGGVITIGDGCVLELDDGTVITGATLKTLGTGVARSVYTSAGGNPPRLVDVLNTGLVDVPDGKLLQLEGGLTNTGTIAVGSAGATTYLKIAGDVTLSGTGVVRLSGGANARIRGNGTNRLISDDGHTMAGGGNLGNNDLSVANYGLVLADDDGEPLKVDPDNSPGDAAAGFVNRGVMRAADGGTLWLFYTPTYDNHDGTIEALDGSAVELDYSLTVSGGLLRTEGTGVIRSICSYSQTNPATLSDVTNTGLVEVPDGKGLKLAGTITNTGTIAGSASASVSSLWFTGSATVTGTGRIALSDDAGNRIRGDNNNRLTQEAGHTLRGSGDLGYDLLSITNHGLILADQAAPLVVNPDTTPTDGQAGVVNTATLRAASGGTLRLTQGAYDNAAGVIEALDASVVELDSVAVITGGLVRTCGSGVVRSICSSVSSPPILSEVTTAGRVEVPEGKALKVADTVTNAGTITVFGDATSGHLIVSGDAALTGTGVVHLAGAKSYLYGQSNNRLTHQADHTIRGAGEVGRSNLSITNHGLIRADQALAMVIDPDDTPAGGQAGVVNTGTLRAASGGTLLLERGSYNNAGGVIEALDGSVVEMASTVYVTDGVVRSLGSGVVRSVCGNGSSSPLTLTDLEVSGRLEVPDDMAVALAGTITNTGTIALLDAGQYAYLRISGDATLTGTGTVAMCDADRNRILGDNGNRLTHAAGHAIRGSGNVGADLLCVTNHGLIQADQPTALEIDPDDHPNDADAGLVNAGVLRATSGGTLRLKQGAYDNAAGVIEALDGSVVELAAHAEVTGGLVRSVGTGVIRCGESEPRLTDLTVAGRVEVPDDKSLGLSGTIAHTGTIALLDAGNHAYLMIRGAVTLAGTGTVAMCDADRNRVYGENDNRLTQQAEHTLRGSGNIGADVLSVTNHGLIQADQPTALEIDPDDAPGDADAGLVNTGVLRAASGATLRLKQGAYDNAGGVIEALDGSVVELAAHAEVTGGLVRSVGTGVIRCGQSEPRLADLTLAGRVEVPDDKSLGLAGTITNTGTIALLDSPASYTTYLYIRGDVVLTGTGVVALSDSSKNSFRGAGADRLTQMAGHAIRGAGALGSHDMLLTNYGLIEAVGEEKLVVDLDGTEGMTNDGSMRAVGAGGLHFANDLAFTNAGSVEVCVASRLEADGDYVQIAGGTRVGGDLLVGTNQAVRIRGGELTGGGTIAGDLICTGTGLVGPGGSVGVLTVDGDVTFGQAALGGGGMARGGLAVEIARHSATPGLGHDQLVVAGDVNDLGAGRLSVVLPPPSAELQPDVLAGLDLTVIDAGGAVTGTGFGEVSAATGHPNPRVADFWAVDTGSAVSVVGSDVVVHGSALTWNAHDGDANLDDVVDVLDLARLANNFGRTDVDFCDADFNLDGVVDVLDLATIANHFGWTDGGAPVPEPVALGLLAAALPRVLKRRRRRWCP